MNYQHSYHAGNFADVLKHVVLIALLKSLQRKDSPYFYLDTHAGMGYYDLSAENPAKTKEYLTGIDKIFDEVNSPTAVQNYIQCIQKLNQQLTGKDSAQLKYYPGSTLIARQVARKQDRLIACELHPNAYHGLSVTFANDKQVRTEHTNGYHALKALLPPKERRGLILIDPPYEDAEEFNVLSRAVRAAIERWQTGIYAIWYPLKNKFQTEHFHRSLAQTLTQPIFVIELTIHSEIPQQLNGCGMAVINPPWQFDSLMQATLPWLWQKMSVGNQGKFEAYFLKK